MTDQIRSFSFLLIAMEVTARATPDRATPKRRISAVSLFLVCNGHKFLCKTNVARKQHTRYITLLNAQLAANYMRHMAA